MIAEASNFLSSLRNHVLARINGYLSLGLKYRNEKNIKERISDFSKEELESIKRGCDQSEVVIFWPNGEVLGVVKLLPQSHGLARIGFKLPRSYRILRAEALTKKQELLVESFHVDIMLAKQRNIV